MELTRWMPWYQKIASTFGYDIQKDREATEVLSQLLSRHAEPFAVLKRSVKNKDVMIFGGGPSLDKNLSILASTKLDRELTLIVADGATTAFLKKSIIPQIIVTDLDGCVHDIIEASKLGSSVIVHAHGDNIDTLREWVPRIIEVKSGGIYGTTQVEPSPPVIQNFGGFTDGDRGAFLAEEMEAKTIILAGMDLGTTIGKYSKFVSSESSSPLVRKKWLSNKKLKLGFAKELLEWLATWSKTKGRLFNATGPKGEIIKGFHKIEFDEIPQIISKTANRSGWQWGVKINEYRRETRSSKEALR